MTISSSTRDKVRRASELGFFTKADKKVRNAELANRRDPELEKLIRKQIREGTKIAKIIHRGQKKRERKIRGNMI